MNRLLAFGDRGLTWLIAFAERQTRSAPYLLAAFWLLFAAVLPWVNSPLGKDPRGMQFALFRDIPALPQLHPG